MNEYKYEDIQLGMKEDFSITVTAEMMQMFLNLTGDTNPLHCDKDFAKQRGYKERVAYGMLTASFLSTLAGVYLPGKNSLIHEVEQKFVAPVFPGDVLSVVGQVVEKNDTFRYFVMKVMVLNSDGKKVLRGKMKVGVLDE